MLSNAKLLAQFCAGDEASFEALFLQHYQRIYSLLFRLLGDPAEAEDVTQQVFLKFYHAAKALQAGNDEVNVRGWLYRVAVNEGYNALRRQKRQVTWQEKFVRLWFWAASPPDPAQVAESHDTQAQVRQILAELKPREAKLLLLRHAGFSYQELAAALELAPTSVGPLLTQAKRAFAQKYRRAFLGKE
ncbi:MAG: sigma-70 family RNA polymerase sigma factor [Anaerolineae bacterium]